MPFTFVKTELDPVVVEYKRFPDERGFFSEIFKQSDFAAGGLPENFVQDNFVFSKKNIIRGLHYQLNPKAQGKLVYCVQGEIWDVAVDIRKSSPSFGKYVAEKLTSENGKGLYIPPGYAHGFVVLSDTAIVIYKMTQEYDPTLEKGILWNDASIAIPWPVQNPIFSERDKIQPALKDALVFD